MTPVTHDLVHATQNSYVGAGLAAQIPFGLYVFKRLLSVGVRSVFGVPGDYNLKLLEHMYDDSLKDTKGDMMEWVGCCNELNAAYAADGYSRYTNGIGTVVTTFGVGELGAISGLAGSCAEDVKVLHIVGVVDHSIPGSKPEMRQRNVHHLVPRLKDSNFVGPDYKIYSEMVKDKIACSIEYLEDLDTACDKVDKVIEDIYKYSKPGFLFVPFAFVDQLVSSKNLINRPTITLQDSVRRSSDKEAQEVTNKILDQLYHSKTPAVVGDVLCDRYGLTKELNDFINDTSIVGFSSVMGKSIIDESNPLYMGVYNGNGHVKSVVEKFLDCDFVLHFGIVKNEINYGNYLYPYKAGAKIVELHPDYVRFWDYSTKEESLYRDVNFVDILRLLREQIDPSRLDLQYDSKFKPYSIEDLKLDENEFGMDETSDITQVFMQKHLPGSLNAGDVFLSDTGSFQFSIRDFKLPSQAKYIAQSIYLSIGMALPAALGVAKGMRDYPNLHITNCEKIEPGYEPRLILLEGDGAAQMTIQELSTILHHKLPIEIFLWNNNGYTIERVIEGPTRPYNDIAPWKWTKLLEAFGDPNVKQSRNSILETRSEFIGKLSELKYRQKREGIDFMEVKLATMDVPSQLKRLVGDMMER